MNRYKNYTDKSLVGVYLFNYPADSCKKREELIEELGRRGLRDWAVLTLLELYEIFNDKWIEREKEIVSEEEEL